MNGGQRRRAAGLLGAGQVNPVDTLGHCPEPEVEEEPVGWAIERDDGMGNRRKPCVPEECRAPGDTPDGSSGLMGAHTVTRGGLHKTVHTHTRTHTQRKKDCEGGKRVKELAGWRRGAVP